MIFAQFSDGEIVAVFSCPQNPDDFPGVERVDLENKKLIEFLKKNNVKMESLSQ